MKAPSEMQQNFMLTGDPLSLDRIRSTLIRLEDTIIFSLIERAQFAHNPKIYERGGIGELRTAGFDGSWLEWFLKETESFHGTFWHSMPMLLLGLNACLRFTSQRRHGATQGIFDMQPPPA